MKKQVKIILILIITSLFFCSISLNANAKTVDKIEILNNYDIGITYSPDDIIFVDDEEGYDYTGDNTHQRTIQV